MRSAADASSGWSDDRAKRAFPSPLTVVLVVLAAGIMLGVVALSADAGLLAWDVRFAYLPAAEALLDGESPYPAFDDPILEDQKGYVYPPQLLFALVPLTPLPVGVASALAAAGLLALLALTLRVLQVRDVRCYAAAFLWVPSVSAVLLGNISIPLAFAVAVAWRYRDDVRRPAAALGIAISAKFVMWPLLVWTVATGRLRASVWAVVVGVLVTLVAWSIIGFDGLTGYSDLLERLSEIQAERSYSIVGMAATAGLPEVVGSALTLLLGGALLVGCLVYARRGDDRVMGRNASSVSTRQPLGITRLGTLVVLGAFPVIVTAMVFVLAWGDDAAGLDFGQFYFAAEAILRGEDPYTGPTGPNATWGGEYPYPPLPGFLAVPLTVLSLHAAKVLVMVLLVAAALAIPFVLDVRDWRCYGLVLLWPPVISAIQTGNLTLFLGLAAALAWRFRDSRAVPSALVGLTLAAKFFLWPLVVWFAATRRP